jgi:hypothetical protein
VADTVWTQNLSIPWPDTPPGYTLRLSVYNDLGTWVGYCLGGVCGANPPPGGPGSVVPLPAGVSDVTSAPATAPCGTPAIPASTTPPGPPPVWSPGTPDTIPAPGGKWQVIGGTTGPGGSAFGNYEWFPVFTPADTTGCQPVATGTATQVTPTQTQQSPTTAVTPTTGGVSSIPSSLPPYPLITPTMPVGVPSQPQIISECDSCQSDAAQAFGTIADKITSAIDTLLKQSAAPIAQCEAAVVGTCDNCNEASANVIGKCCNKVRTHANRMLSESYQQLAMIGVQYPTAEQVMYGLSTGDYLGSVGLAPLQGQVIIANDGTLPPGVVPIVSCETTDAGIQCLPVTQLPVNVDILQPITQPTQQPSVSTSTPTIPVKPTPDVTTSESYSSTEDDLKAIAGLFVKPKGTYDERKAAIDEAIAAPVDQSATDTVNQLTVPADWLAAVSTVGNWCSIDACKQAVAALQSMPDSSNLFTFYLQDGSYYVPKWFLPILQGVPDAAKPTVFAAAFMLGGLAKNSIDVLARLRGCDPSSMSGAVTLSLLTGLTSRLTGGMLDGFFQGLKYSVNATCPTELPDKDNADTAYLAGVISRDEWNCWVAANNQCLNQAEKVQFAKRTKPDAYQELLLYRWGQISPDRYAEAMRNLGYVSRVERQEFEKANEAVPPVSDLIRYMIRDVGDQSVVDKYHLLDQFEQKWTGVLKQWGDAQGMTDELSKAAWAAHWDYPSATQAFEMLHRLRPDSISANRLNAQSIDNDGPGVITTQADVNQLLEINDLAWFWRDRMSAISYRPMTRLDSRHAYSSGQMTDAEMVSAYQDIGYSLTDAEKLLQFDIANKAKLDGKPSSPALLSNVTKAYVAGYIAEANMAATVRGLYRDKLAGNKQVDIINQQQKLAAQKLQVNCLRKQYMQGMVRRYQSVNRHSWRQANCRRPNQYGVVHEPLEG